MKAGIIGLQSVGKTTIFTYATVEFKDYTVLDGDIMEIWHSG